MITLLFEWVPLSRFGTSAGEETVRGRLGPRALACRVCLSVCGKMWLPIIDYAVERQLSVLFLVLLGFLSYAVE